MKTLGEMKIVMHCRKHGKGFPLLIEYSMPENFARYVCVQCNKEGRYTSITLKLAEYIEAYPPIDGKSPAIWKSMKGPPKWIKYDFGAGEKIRLSPDYTSFKDVRLFDPRTGKLTKPGNGNPALFLRDLFIRAGIKIDKSKDARFKELADYCDEKLISASFELTGNIKAGVLPAWGKILEACGMERTVKKATSVTYKAPADLNGRVKIEAQPGKPVRVIVQITRECYERLIREGLIHRNKEGDLR